MSSLVSLRSRERRKSAGARLQTSSQCDYLSRAPEKNLKQELRPSSQLRAGPGIPELHARVPRRRVKSALETRKEQEASNIFNRQEKVSPPVDPKWGVTKYSEDFGPKRRITPIPMRPTSSTRRNNPHPSKVRVYVYVLIKLTYSDPLGIVWDTIRPGLQYAMQCDLYVRDIPQS